MRLTYAKKTPAQTVPSPEETVPSPAKDLAVRKDSPNEREIARRKLELEQAGEAMPTAEFKAWRKRCGLSLDGAARALGLSRRIIAYYASGKRVIPKYILLACRGYEATTAEAGLSAAPKSPTA